MRDERSDSKGGCNVDSNKLILPIFAVGLVVITLYALYQKELTLAATALGAIAGVFSLPKQASPVVSNTQAVNVVSDPNQPAG